LFASRLEDLVALVEPVAGAGLIQGRLVLGVEPANHVLRELGADRGRVRSGGSTGLAGLVGALMLAV
jgi:hypothetical protein